MAVSTILVGRFLGPELYGQYSLAIVVPSLLLLFADLGINQGITKFTASLRAKGETERLAKIIQHGLILRAAAGIAIFILNYALADFFASVFLQRPDLAFYTRIASTAILFQVIFVTAVSAFVGLDKTEYNALATNIQAIAKAIISIALVLLGFSITGALIGYVTSYVIAALVALAILYLVLQENRNPSNNQNISNDIKAMIRYGAPLYASLILIGLLPLYQSVVLAFFTTDTDIGNYKAASNFIALISILSIPIATALLPAFSKLDSSTKQKITTFFKLANKSTTIIIIPVTVLIIIFANEIVQIVYGSDYQSAPLFLEAFCLLYFSVGLGYLTLHSFYNGLGETKTTLKMSIINFLALLVLSPILTRTYNVIGLIAASLTASFLSTAYGSYIARKNHQVKFDTASTVRIYLIAMLAGVPPLLLRLAPLPDLMIITAGGLLYLFIYATLVPLARIINNNELHIAEQIIHEIPILAQIGRPILKYEQKILNTKHNHDPPHTNK